MLAFDLAKQMTASKDLDVSYFCVWICNTHLFEAKTGSFLLTFVPSIALSTSISLHFQSYIPVLKILASVYALVPALLCIPSQCISFCFLTFP